MRDVGMVPKINRQVIRNSFFEADVSKTQKPSLQPSKQLSQKQLTSATREAAAAYATVSAPPVTFSCPPSSSSSSRGPCITESKNNSSQHLTCDSSEIERRPKRSRFDVAPPFSQEHAPLSASPVPSQPSVPIAFLATSSSVGPPLLDTTPTIPSLGRGRGIRPPGMMGHRPPIMSTAESPVGEHPKKKRPPPAHGEFYGSDTDEEGHQRQRHRGKRGTVDWNAKVRDKIEQFKVH